MFKLPAPCYSPAVLPAVPLPQGSLTVVFEMGTSVSTPLWAPETALRYTIFAKVQIINLFYCRIFYVSGLDCLDKTTLSAKIKYKLMIFGESTWPG